jgi:uncharacterized protein (TIGR02300 family)
LFKGRALTGRIAYGKARARTPPTSFGPRIFDWRQTLMVKPEWGTKRTCPKCSTRFYDLGNGDPVHCIECGTEWVPEPVLKSKQPLPFEAVETKQKEAPSDQDLEAEDLAIDEEEEPSADEEVDLDTGDDDLGVERAAEDDEA